MISQHVVVIIIFYVVMNTISIAGARISRGSNSLPEISLKASRMKRSNLILRDDNFSCLLILGRM